jgi:hypothetical protein
MAELKAMPRASRRLPSLEEAEGWIGWRVDDINGSTVGQVDHVCCDAHGAPAWIVVGEDHLEGRRRFVIPARDAIGCISGRVWSPHPRQLIRRARIEDQQVAPGDELRLRAHFAPVRAA